MENEIMYIKLDDIIPNRFQPREIFDEEALEKLADSIRQHGVIEPILVRPVSNKYEIVAGERRYKASILAGLTKIPAMVRQLDDKKSSIIAYIENEHRSNVSAIEEARTIERILNNNDMTQDELAKELGISQSTLANKLRLLALPMEVQEALMHNEISERHARSLLSVKEVEKQLELLKKIKEKRMTVRELDSEIKNMENGNNNFASTGGNQFVSFLNQNGNANNQQSSNLTSFLNNYEDEKKETPPVQGEANPTFMNFLNNYEGPKEEKPMDNQAANPDFMNFLNNYEGPKEEKTTETEAANPDFMNFLNNYEGPKEEKPAETEAANPDFMNFLNNYEGPKEEKPAETEAANPDFMNFLNNYEGPKEEKPSETEAANPDFMNFLNNYEGPKEEKPTENKTANPNFDNFINNNGGESIETLDDNNTNNNLLINNVNPPISSNFNANDYIENNPNYVDVSKKITIDNIDTIINKLKNVIDEIKNNSKFKIDTDEINYDDIYQITIKIDKRDF